MCVFYCHCLGSSGIIIRCFNIIIGVSYDRLHETFMNSHLPISVWYKLKVCLFSYPLDPFIINKNICHIWHVLCRKSYNTRISLTELSVRFCRLMWPKIYNTLQLRNIHAKSLHVYNIFTQFRLTTDKGILHLAQMLEPLYFLNLYDISIVYLYYIVFPFRMD